MLNYYFSCWMMLSLGAFAVLPFLYRFVSVLYSQIRLLVSLNSENQKYFATPSTHWIPWMKKHVLYSPLFRVRHNREFQISEAINVGTLPTRFQTFFLLGYVTSNVAFCTYMIDFSDHTTMLNELRNRSGVMATVNMIPLILMAARNNPLVGLLGISFDSFNLIHRWLGRIVVIEALTHVISYLVGKVGKAGWGPVKEGITSSPFIMPGFVAICAFTFILLHSPSAIRHAFYETFLLLHILAAAVAIAGVWYHLAAMPDLALWLCFLRNAILLWGTDRAIRLARILYRNVGRKMTKATVEALPGDATRVTIRMARPWTLKPGQHLYLYMPKVALWTSHPFTITWSEDEQHIKLGDEKLPMNRQDIVHQTDRTMSLIIRRRTGFTNALFKKAYDSPNKTFTTTVLAEGPYGKIDTLGSYGTVVLVAGGVGITHPVPYIRELVEGYANGTVATRRVTLIWVIQTPEHLEWIRPWMTKILAMEKRRDVLKILLFVTRPKSTKEIHSPSSTVQMFPGRPNFNTLLNMEIEGKMGSMVVTVCGGGSLSDDVRKAVRAKQDVANIDFVEEAFSW
ncbi:ferric reductase like transmembrane component-domain-containing protein [Trichophaea hybrida]|nr:ferric reductase like transmembrane component-domain-containing protein [Trichophaea hybrida]